MIEDLTLKQLKQIQALFSGDSPERPKAKEKDLGLHIVVLQRGWVCVGRYYRKGNECRLENASVIRRWGTTKGLGELADTGPLSNTILEPCPYGVTFHRGAEVLAIKCKATAWA